ncbi:MAG: flagellar brake protein [Methylomonas sp.]
MLEKIKKIFLKTSPVEEDDVSVEDLVEPENPNFLTEPEKIVKLLSEIEASSPLCTIQIEDSNEDYSSSILDIKVNKNTIILDELIPREGNALLQRKKALKLFTFHKGIHLSFNLEKLETGHSHGITYYKALIPGRVYYPQRRRSPRIEIRTIDISFSGVAQRTGVSVVGYVFDLSRDGAGIEIPVNRARVQRGDKIKGCQISFEDYVMDFDFNVRFVKPVSTGSSKVQIGGFFENLSPKSQSKLSHFITSLERVEIRKQKA